jgi:hypothetical protein
MTGPFLLLHRWGEKISGEFNLHDIANLCHVVYVCDGGNTTGGWMVGQLERWTEKISGEFILQSVVNTLWTFVTMGTNPGELMMGEVEPWEDGDDIRGVEVSVPEFLCEFT